MDDILEKQVLDKLCEIQVHVNNVDEEYNEPTITLHCGNGPTSCQNQF